MNPHWKKIDKNALPEGEVLTSLDGHPGKYKFGKLTVAPSGKVYCQYNSALGMLATHYLDPSEIPMPWEVKLDWWRPGYDQYIAIHNGIMYKAYGIGDFGNYRATAQEKGKTPIYIDGPGLRSLDAAKAACERYAANLLNQDKPEKSEL